MVFHKEDKFILKRKLTKLISCCLHRMLLSTQVKFISTLWSKDQIVNHIESSSSAIAEGPCDTLCHLKSCQLLHNCTKNHID